MGHARQLYICHLASGLEEIRGPWGLDKMFAVRRGSEVAARLAPSNGLDSFCQGPNFSALNLFAPFAAFASFAVKGFR